MARKRIDWEALEPALRRLKKEELLQVLHHAYRELPASRVVSLFGEYVDLTTLHSPPLARNDAAPRRLFKAVQKFHADSLAGQYYESFRVDSRNFLDKSEGTKLWISECNQRCYQFATARRREYPATSIGAAISCGPLAWQRQH